MVFSRAPLVGSVRFERLKLVLWFRYRLLAKDMMPPKPSVLLLETVEVGELARESDSASESLASFKLLGRSSL